MAYSRFSATLSDILSGSHDELLKEHTRSKGEEVGLGGRLGGRRKGEKKKKELHLYYSKTLTWQSWQVGNGIKPT